MKFVHTADWHLGWKYQRTNFADNLLKQVERIIDIAFAQGADAIVVAGDVFEAKSGSAKMISEACQRLKPWVDGGKHLLLIPGNHDCMAHFDMMVSLLSLVVEDKRRVHVCREVGIVEIEGVQFACVPYPRRGSDVGDDTPNRTASQALDESVKEMCSELDGDKPSVLVAHISVSGASFPSEKRVDKNEITMSRDAWPPSLAYVALGHIHKQQKLLGAVPAWYSGSIERLNMGERAELVDNLGVLIVDVPERGPASVMPISLKETATPFYKISVAADEIDSLPEKYPDLNQAIVSVAVTDVRPDDEAHKDNLLRKKVRDVCYKINTIEIEDTRSRQERVIIVEHENPETTVRKYLEEHFGEDPNKDALIQDAIELIKASSKKR